MKKSLGKLSIATLIIVASIIFLSSNALAQIAPFLTIDGNYTYTDLGNGTGSLTFSDNNPNWATYTNGESGCAYPVTWNVCDYQDDIMGNNGVLGSEISFGTLTNSSGSPTFFGSASLSVFEISTGNVFFSANLNDLDMSLPWNNLSNVIAGTAPSSRYVTELLANGNGNGNIQFSFTPTGGGTEDFVGSSSGSAGITVAAPEPVSMVLFITGGATLALSRFRKKRI